MMMSPDEEVLISGNTDESESHQRSRIKFEPSLSIRVKQISKHLPVISIRDMRPVKLNPIKMNVASNELQRRREFLPLEESAKDRMTIKYRLPGKLESRSSKIAVDEAAELTNIDAAGRRVESVEQHALLHRRERIDIFYEQVRRSDRVKSVLIERRQREVRRSVSRTRRISSLSQDGFEREDEQVSKALNGRMRVEVSAEREVDVEAGSDNNGVDVEQVRANGARAASRASRERRRREEGGRREGVIELAEIVEADERRRERLNRRRDANVIRKEAEQREAEAGVRNRAKQVFDKFKMVDDVNRVRERKEDREDGSEPADGAR